MTNAQLGARPSTGDAATAAPPTETRGRAAPIPVAADPPAARRLLGVDAFRGAVLAFMLLTPTLGDGSYPLLRHADWDGWTLSDLVFPAFLVTSGASLAFLLKPPVTAAVHQRLVRRVLALVVLGVLYNAYGDVGADLAYVRLTGVLQLIGLSGGLAAAVVLATRRPDGADRPRLLAAVALAVIAGFGVGLAVLGDACDGEARCSPYHAVDLALLGRPHVYTAGDVAFDPEGVVVVVAASALVLAGYLAGRHLRVRRPLDARALLTMLAVAAGLVAAGLLLGGVQPVNKQLHTPAFSLLAAGAAVGGLAAFSLALDRPARGGARVTAARSAAVAPFLVLGRNALVVFVGERLLRQSAAATTVGDSTLQDWLLANVVPFGGDRAALGYGLVLLGALLVVTAVMRALRWYVAL